MKQGLEDINWINRQNSEGFKVWEKGEKSIKASQDYDDDAEGIRWRVTLLEPGGHLHTVQHPETVWSVVYSLMVKN